MDEPVRCERVPTFSREPHAALQVGTVVISRMQDRVELRHGERRLELRIEEARVVAAALLQLTR